MTQLVSVGEVRLQIINPRIRHDFFTYGILDALMLDAMIQGLLQMNLSHLKSVSTHSVILVFQSLPPTRARGVSSLTKH